MPSPETARRLEPARTSSNEPSKLDAPEKPARPTGPARRKRALPLEVVSAGMIARRVDVLPRDVVYLKGILEASEGLGAIFAERGGELVVTAPLDRGDDLEELLRDIALELGASVEPRALPCAEEGPA